MWARIYNNPSSYLLFIDWQSVQCKHAVHNTKLFTWPLSYLLPCNFRVYAFQSLQTAAGQHATCSLIALINNLCFFILLLTRTLHHDHPLVRALLNFSTRPVIRHVSVLYVMLFDVRAFDVLRGHAGPGIYPGCTSFTRS